MMHPGVQLSSLLGHMISLLRHNPHAPEGAETGEEREHRDVLRSLHQMVSERSYALRLTGSELRVEGEVVPASAPFVRQLVEQMQGHRIARIHIPHETPPFDLMVLLRAMALDLTDYGPQHSVENSLLAVGVKSVSVVTAEEEHQADQRRAARVTEALAITEGLGPLEGAGLPEAPAASPEQGERSPPASSSPTWTAAPAAPPAVAPGPVPSPSAPATTATPAPPPAAPAASIGQRSTAATEYEAALNQLLSTSARKSKDMARVASDVSGREVLAEIEARWRAVAKALRDGRLDRALDEMGALLRGEEAAVSDAEKLAYPGAVERLLNDENLRLFVTRAVDELYARDVVALVKRAGKAGTVALLDALVKAPTFAERRAYLKALRQVEKGTEAIVGMLTHREWYVVRNMADLAGELRIEEAVSALGKALDHPDDRVRRSVGAALAKLESREAVQYLRRVLDDPERSVRAAVFAEVGQRSHGALAMPLVAAAEGEEDPALRGVYLRALGRIGTPEAIDALRRAAEPGGMLRNRRSVSDRLAAVEGLALSRDRSSVRVALQALAKDKQRDVREAAERALKD
jgi:HEAT repeat protein